MLIKTIHTEEVNEVTSFPLQTTVGHSTELSCFIYRTMPRLQEVLTLGGSPGTQRGQTSRIKLLAVLLDLVFLSLGTA
jgi:hypothetical protein